MNLTNTTKFPAAWTMGMDPGGRELLVVALKATYTIPTDGSDPRPAASQVPLVEADVFAGEPGLSAPVYECDFAPRKPRCDVTLNGSAYAPGGVPATEVPVLLQVGSLSKTIRVVGVRGWVKGVFGWNVTRPIPFARMAISYANAFGGRDVEHPDEKKHRWYPRNHAGVGFHANLDVALVEGRHLPNTEEPGKPVEKPDGAYRPMAFGPIGRSWEPRFKLAGTYDKHWQDNVCPFLPSDFKDEYHQSAPPDQQIPYPKGGEEVVLVNLTPQGRTSFRLPPTRMPVTVFPKGRDFVELEAAMDTLVIEPDHGRFTMTWRASYPLRRNIFEIVDVFAGPMSKAQLRAREMGKLYCASLSEAIRRAPRRPRSPETPA